MPELPLNHLELTKWLHDRLNPAPDEPIGPEDEIYVQIYRPEEDHVRFMLKQIVVSGPSSVRMFSGARGSGKTTELFRLQKDLEKVGYCVFRVDALEYLNPAEPISIVDLLLTVPSALAEAVGERLGSEFIEKHWLGRLWDYLKSTDLQVEDFGIKTPAHLASVELRAKLRTTPTFRQRLQERLQNRIFELKDKATAFIAEVTKALQARAGPPKGVVLLLDQFEQIRGSLTNEREVMDSVERLFTHHSELLHWEYLHVVYTVPPWLRYRAGGAAILEKMLPCVKLYDYPPTAAGLQPIPHGWVVFREVLRRRFTDAGLRRVFGDPNADGSWAELDKIVHFSGGYLRDLLYIADDAILRADVFPVDSAIVDRTITELRKNYPIAANDAVWLREIHRTGQNVLPDSEPATVARFARYLDLHQILLCTNGYDTYAVHPLVIDEVNRVADRVAVAMKAIEEAASFQEDKGANGI